MGGKGNGVFGLVIKWLFDYVYWIRNFFFLLFTFYGKIFIGECGFRGIKEIFFYLLKNGFIEYLLCISFWGWRYEYNGVF